MYLIKKINFLYIRLYKRLIMNSLIQKFYFQFLKVTIAEGILVNTALNKKTSNLFNQINILIFH